MRTVSAPPRIYTPRNQKYQSLGWYFDDISERLGFEPHLWQSLANDIGAQLSERVDPFPGQSKLKYHAQHVGMLVGRQSGKTSWSAARIAGQALLSYRTDIAEMVGLKEIKPQTILYTAQSRINAVNRFQEHCAIIEGSSLGRYVEHVSKKTGHESLTFTNGSTYSIVTPNRSAGRGIAADLVIVDEALTHPLWLLGVLRPTMAQRHTANGCIGAQFVVISNAGNDDSELLNHLQDLGRESAGNGDDARVWLEWSMTPNSEPLSEETWLSTMPTLNQPNGIGLEYMREEAKSMRLADFMREYLCVRINSSDDRVIDIDQWDSLYRDDIQVIDSPVLGVDISWNRDRASIVAAGATGEYLPVEVIEAREGVEWLADRISGICERWNCPVVIDTAGPAAALHMILENRGIEVIPFAARDVANAAGFFYDNIRSKRIAHNNDWRLNDAVRGATKRAIGERWGFDRKGKVDISPLVAASFAVYAVESGRFDKPTIYT